MEKVVKFGCFGVFLFLVCFIIGNCIKTLSQPEITRVDTIKDIDRIIMHERDSYSFLVGDHWEAAATWGCHDSQPTKVLYDAGDGKCWAEKHYTKYAIDGWQCTGIILHIHNPQEINPGGWDHGKFGRGQNVEIE
jgi:hypothetical protein